MGWDDHNDNSFEGQNFNSSNLKTNEALMKALMTVRVRGSENVTWPRSHVEMRYLWGSEWIEPLHGSIVCDHAVHAVHVEHHLTQRCNQNHWRHRKREALFESASIKSHTYTQQLRSKMYTQQPDRVLT